MTTDAHQFAPLHFTTADLPERERLSIWREAFARAVMKVDVAPIDDTPFEAELNMRLLPGLSLSWGRHSSQRSTRTRDLVAGGDDDLIVVMGVTGIGAFEQVARTALVAAGGALVLTGAETGIAECSAAFSHVTLKLERSRLASLVRDVDDVIMKPLDPDNEALRLLRLYIGAMQDRLALGDPELCRAAVNHVYDLVALAIGTSRATGELAAMRGLRAARLQSILDLIRQEFDDPAFSSAVAAAKLQLSPRYLQNLLHETGTTFTERVLEMRLQHAHQLLSDRRNDHMTVAAIAEACGFNEVSYFNRCFRRRFGQPPTASRAPIRKM
jgi:AraC-like DNA-binding protein